VPTAANVRVETAYTRTWKEAAPALAMRARLRALLRSARLFQLRLMQKPADGAFLRLLYCHHVFDDQVRRFREVILRLVSIGTFVDTDACVAMVRGERPIDGRCFHLSFDDGFRNIRENAAPILNQLGIPALVCVPTALVEADWETSRRFAASGNYSAPIQFLNWEEVRELQGLGFQIGSHAATHVRLSSLSTEQELEAEIAGSKATLEDKLQAECKCISWPYGKPPDINQGALAVVRRAGYRACFGAFRGSVRVGLTDTFQIPRHHFEAHWPLAHVDFFARGGMEGPP
jgi:peptidoglycan/xylan/chitin deacetylase (PgdA/CDA1 family)